MRNLGHTVEAHRGMVTVHRGRKPVYAGTPAHVRWLCRLLLATADRIENRHPFQDDPGRPGRCGLCWQIEDHPYHEDGGT